MVSFSISPESLSKLFEPDNIRNGKSIEILNSFDGISGIFSSVKSSISKGITEEASEIQQRVKQFGDNRPHIYNKKSFFHFLFEPLKDTVLQILVVAAFISLIVGAIEDPKQG